VIASHVLVTQVTEEAAATADEFEEAAASCVVMLMHLEMCSEFLDASSEDRDLNIGRAGVSLVAAKFLDDSGTGVLVQVWGFSDHAGHESSV